jgi:S-DNA-T family DNA segregation ATPase FtsK/SpoIIIE
MRPVVSGQQLAQVKNGDPFAPPIWRAPIYHTPGWLVAAAQITRTVWAILRFLARHPVADLAALTLFEAWRLTRWPGPAALILITAAVLVTWRLRWPASFTRWVHRPALSKWRHWHYARHWNAVMSIARLAAVHHGRILVPVLGKVVSTGCTDRVRVRLVSGQCPADYAARTENLAHGFGAYLCRVRTARPGWITLELVRRDALAAIITAFPTPAAADLKALPVGRREDGTLWLVRLHGTHLLVAGSTGAGKGSILWGLVRALLGHMQAGLVKILAADPKLMELAYGRAIFDTYGNYESDPYAIVAMLEQAVTDMQARAAVLAGKQRDHAPTTGYPFVVVLVDEVAFLTAYHPDKSLRERVKATLATLTTQGRAVGYCVVAALQDPRKEVMSIRNLFPDRIAMRLDEPEQVDMVLGDGARDRGAHADLISTNPAIGAGVAFVRLEADPDPIRVRAAWVSDPDIEAMAAACTQTQPDEGLADVLAIEPGAAACVRRH